MHGPGSADFFERTITRSLGPAIAVQIGEQAFVGFAMHVDCSTEGRRGKHGLHLCARPVLGPIAEEFFLPLAEQLQTRKIHDFRVVSRVVYVIRSRSHHGNLPERTGLKLAIFENGKVDAADSQACEVNRNAAFHGRWIDRIGQVPGLLALHLVHIIHRIKEASVSAIFAEALLAAFAPKIGLAHVVVIGKANRWPVPHHIAELQSELNPTGGVFGVAIGLVAGEEQQVGILRLQMLDDLRPQAASAAGVAAHAGDHDHVLFNGIAADETFKHCPLAVTHTIGDVLRAIPTFHAEVCVPARIINLACRDFLPLAVAIHFEPSRPLLAGLKREKLRTHLQHAVVMRVKSEGDDILTFYVH